MSTTLPRRPSVVNGEELSHVIPPGIVGIAPSSLRAGIGAAAMTGFDDLTASIKCSSALLVFTKEILVRRFVSQPRARATSPMITATPRARRIHTSNDNDRFIAAK